MCTFLKINKQNAEYFRLFFIRFLTSERNDFMLKHTRMCYANEAERKHKLTKHKFSIRESV